MKDKVSVIIPVYNVQDYLEACVESVLRQTYSNLEIILVDDGSTDDSARLCDSLELRDDRIVVIHKKNGGLSSSRNAGLEIAIGKFISFVDSDDIIDSLFIESLTHAMKIADAEIAIAPIKLLYNDGSTTDFYKSREGKITSLSYIVGILNHKLDNSVCNKLFLRESIGNLRFKEGIINEDFPFVISYLSHIYQVALVNRSPYYYRQRDGSITQQANPHLYDFIINGFTVKRQLKADLMPEVDKYILYECVNFISVITKFDAYDRFTTELKFVNNHIRMNLKSLLYGDIGYRQVLKLCLVKFFPDIFRKLSK